MSKKERVVVYIDGFNLYRGMIQSWQDTKWLDVYSLCESLMKPNQHLVEVKYFTARVIKDPPKEKRQSIYLEAIEEMGTSIKYGQYLANSVSCRKCKCKWTQYKEKMTDVNIAVDIIIDAVHDLYDMALVISGDSDLVPPIKAVYQNFTDKRVVVAFPPNRKSISLEKAAKRSFILGRKKLIDNQLPISIVKKNGYVLKKPSTWI